MQLLTLGCHGITVSYPLLINLPLPPLLLIADRATCSPRPLPDALILALEAGVRFVQLREKDLDRASLAHLAREIQEIVRRYDAVFCINSFADVAAEVGAGGVHLPASGPSARAIRSKFGSEILIGCSTHNSSELKAAKAGKADFVTYSPIFSPGSRTSSSIGLGIPSLKRAAKSTDIPIYALGGITPGRAATCVEAGAYGVAVMSGILSAPNVRRATEEFLRALEIT